MRRVFVLIFIPAAIASLFYLNILGSVGPPSIDMFVERWDVLPPAYDGLVILGQKGYYKGHEIVLTSNLNAPSRLMVYYWRPEKRFIEGLAERLGLGKVVDMTGRPYISMNVQIYGNETHWMKVRGFSRVEFGVAGYRPHVGQVTQPPDKKAMKIAVRWLEDLGIYSKRIYMIEPKPSGVIVFKVRFGEFEADSPAAEVEVRDGRVIYAKLNLILLLAQPYKEFELKDLDSALKLLKATIDIGGVLSNARGWSPEKDARLSAIFSTSDFNVATIGKIEIKYHASWPGYVIPIYVFKGVTDSGEDFTGTVDAIYRG